MKTDTDDLNGWGPLLAELEQRVEAARAMGGEDRLARQASKDRLDARERIARLCDKDSFVELGALGAGQDPGGSAPVPADGLVGGLARIDARAVCVLAEDFTVQGGSIGHVNAAKRLRLVNLAQQERVPLVLMLDGAGERASNAFDRYPFAPNDLQALADLHGQVPIVTLVLGTSAGHGALCGLFGDFIVMGAGASFFAAGPPLVRASLGIETTPVDLGGAEVHARHSGVAHNVAATEDEAFELTRRFLAHLPQNSNGTAPRTQVSDGTRVLDEILKLVPADERHAYDMRKVLELLCDPGSLLEVQPLFGASMIVAFAGLGGHSVLIVANQPQVLAGSITADAAEKAAHFLTVAATFGLPVVFLADNPGVMPGPDAEKVGTLRSAARMYAAQRSIRAPKIHVTLRKAFGFGSSIMGMNPFDRQTMTLAFPGISLGGLPAVGGADASGASAEDAARMKALQSGAWTAADNASYDRVIDPRELRNELIRALEVRCEGDTTPQGSA